MPQRHLRRAAHVTLVLLLALALPAAAQTKGISLGFEGLLSNLTSTSSAYSSDDEFGYRFGASYSRFVKQRLFFEGGVYYEDAGFNLTGPNGLRDDVRIRGIRVPAMVGIGIGAPKLNLELSAGPTVTFRTSVNSNIFTIGSDDVNGVLFGGTAGVSARLFFLNATVGYDFGFTNLFSGSAQQQFGSGNLNHWRLTLGFIVGG
ncbi:MAG: outer membrane beta-barrel protein [Gemmatimonadales bacterium]|jgi:hypothetical protein|nr:outer membrane beta-barrel protein [Gemmatimonadales bacterium]